MSQPISAKIIERHISGDIQACNTLLTLLEQEQEALASRDPDILAAVVEQKIAPLTHLENSAKQRGQWAMIGDNEKASDSWNTMLAELAQDKIKEDWETLKELTQKCKQMNEVNGKILGRQQQVYGRLIELLRGQTQAPTLYTSLGTATAGHSSFKVDEA